MPEEKAKLNQTKGLFINLSPFAENSRFQARDECVVYGENFRCPKEFSASGDFATNYSGKPWALARGASFNEK